MAVDTPHSIINLIVGKCSAISGVALVARDRLYSLTKAQLPAVLVVQEDLIPDEAVRPWTVNDYRLFVRIDVITAHAEPGTTVITNGGILAEIQVRLRLDPSQGSQNVYNTIEHAAGPPQWDQDKDKTYLVGSLRYEFQYRYGG